MFTKSSKDLTLQRLTVSVIRLSEGWPGPERKGRERCALAKWPFCPRKKNFRTQLKQWVIRHCPPTSVPSKLRSPDAVERTWKLQTQLRTPVICYLARTTPLTVQELQLYTILNPTSCHRCNCKLTSSPCCTLQCTYKIILLSVCESGRETYSQITQVFLMDLRINFGSKLKTAFKVGLGYNIEY